MNLPQVSQADLSQALYEVTIRLPNTTLEVLSHTVLWRDIALASQDQNWWFRRTEYLVGRQLTYRIGDWARVYTSLEKNGLDFDRKHNYRSLLLVQVLLEIGADPSGPIPVRAIPRGTSTYDDKRISYIPTRPLEFVIRDGNLEAVALLLQDSRVDTASNRNAALRLATRMNREDIIELLLSHS